MKEEKERERERGICMEKRGEISPFQLCLKNHGIYNLIEKATARKRQYGQILIICALSKKKLRKSCSNTHHFTHKEKNIKNSFIL